jgi:hypothetical protein
VLDATLAQGLEPGQHGAGIKEKLRDDQGCHAALFYALAFAFQHLPPVGYSHEGMTFRMSYHADMLDAKALEHAVSIKDKLSGNGPVGVAGSPARIADWHRWGGMWRGAS